MAEPLRAVIADDNYLVREGTRRLLEDSGEVTVQAAAGSAPQGRGNAGIAQELSLSESSVEKHVNAIFTKLGLSSEQLVHRRVAAVLTFLRHAGLRLPG